jgi:hypothetical protein
LTPHLRPRSAKRVEPTAESFEFVEAICVEAFRVGFVEEVPRGRVWPKDHYLVERHPQFWRLLGPRPDAEGVNDG